MSAEIKNTSDLRKMLLETIEGVRSGSIEAGKANAIANLSTKVLQSAKLDLDMLHFRATHKDIDEAGAKVLQLITA